MLRLAPCSYTAGFDKKRQFIVSMLYYRRVGREKEIEKYRQKVKLEG